MRIKEEYSASGNTTSFAEKVESHLSPYKNIYRGGGGTYIYLGDLRGMIVILRDY